MYLMLSLHWFDEERDWSRDSFTHIFYHYKLPESAEKLWKEFYDLLGLQTLLN